MKIKLYGLAYDCPYGKREKNYPYLPIEHVPFKEKVDWINKLNDKGRMAILKHHFTCTLYNK